MSTDTPHRQLKERLRQERAELILEIAEVMFIDKGYHDTSMDEIAARAGVAKGTLYQHFPGKEDLVFALFERHLERFERMIEQIAASTETASAKLERILRYAYLEQHGMRTQSLQFLYRNRDMRNILIENKGRIRDRLGRPTGQIRAMLEEGKIDGSFNPELSTGLMLISFMSLLTFSSWEQFISQERFSPEELIDQVGRIFFEGIKRK